MFMAIFILLFLPLLDFSYIRSYSFRPIMKIFYWLFIFNFLLLLWIGAKPVEDPYIFLGALASVLYFL